jgi:hypothetical protein
MISLFAFIVESTITTAVMRATNGWREEHPRATEWLPLRQVDTGIYSESVVGAPQSGINGNSAVTDIVYKNRPK